MSERFVQRVYKFRCYPTTSQVKALERQFAFACELYNAALEQRRTLWRERGLSITHKHQSKQLTELRQAWAAEHPELLPEGMSRSAMQKTLERLDRSFKAFYRRAQGGERPGFPRFKSRRRWDSLQAQYGHGCRFTSPETLDGKKGSVYWSGVGELKVKAHRPLPAEARTTEVQLKRVAGGREWYAFLVVEMPARAPLQATGERVGIDVGITTFATLSNGEQIQGPRSYRRHERRLARLQADLSRCRRGSRRREKRQAQLARAHARIGRIRRDHAHKTARSLVERFDALYLEDLNIKGLARSKLAAHVTDQAWGSFAGILADKAEEAGRLLVKVDPRGSSQECSGCGAAAPKVLAERTHVCTTCGLLCDRDVNAARVIFRRGERLREALMAGGHKPRQRRTRNRPVLRAA